MLYNAILSIIQNKIKVLPFNQLIFGDLLQPIRMPPVSNCAPSFVDIFVFLAKLWSYALNTESR